MKPFHQPPHQMPHSADAPSKSMASQFAVRRGDECANCGLCKRVCIYGVHERLEEDPRFMAPPKQEMCRGCLRCVMECPRNAITVVPNADSDVENIILFEASTGKVPVSGAGYGGRFGGYGFDGIWLDMSEIVRPTRDGIHGREYISTVVEIGRFPPYLKFGDGEVEKSMEELFTIEVPFPILFREVSAMDSVVECILEATSKLGTYMIVSEDTYDAYPSYRDNMLVEVDVESGMMDEQRTITRVEVRSGIEELVYKLFKNGCAIVHLTARGDGRSYDGKFAGDIVESVHDYLMSKGVREVASIVFSGGILKAEHVPKSLILGADAVAIDKPLLIALEYADCLSSDLSIDWGVQRIINLMCSWRDQLLEVLGAMGMRDVRRIRGEKGRAMFMRDLENEFIQNCGFEVHENDDGT